MNPREILAWVAAICAAIFIITLTIAVVVALIQTIRHPQPKKRSEKIL